MAEIKIQEKRKTNWLPLVLGAVLLLALLGWCTTRDRAPQGAAPTDPAASTQPTPPAGGAGAATGGGTTP